MSVTHRGEELKCVVSHYSSPQLPSNQIQPVFRKKHLNIENECLVIPEKDKKGIFRSWTTEVLPTMYHISLPVTQEDGGWMFLVLKVLNIGSGRRV